ncbi:MAG: ABC transporter permease [Bacteroidales bacterium]|jgi:putative ABC transport system permease protein|nr:ABC transporter permease [Bacteroidales bacterium]
MIRYFFKLAFRNIRKYKVNTFISLLGLTVGLASFILIASYIKHELSFNQYNENYEQIFVANIDNYWTEGIEHSLIMPYPLLDKLVSEFPEVKIGVRIGRAYVTVANVNDNISFFAENGYYADNSIFDIFTVDFLSGDNKNALSETNTIVLTKSYAKKYFGDVNPIGKDLLIDKNYIVKVTAVIDDMPVNSDFRYDFFMSMPTLLSNSPHRDYTQRWNEHKFETFIILNENCDYEILNEKIRDIIIPLQGNTKRVLYLTPLSSFHLKSNALIKILVIFGLVAVFILIIACLNFINLSIANAANRIKETSIRRIVGGSKSSLILQQVGESVLLSFISFDLAYLLVERLLPGFNAILQTEVPSSVILNFPFIISMFAIATLLGLVSAIFPSIKISRINPQKALAGRGKSIDRAGLGKKALIVFQYTVSIILIIATIILSQQFNFIKNKDLGFDADYIITCYVKKPDRTSNPNLKILRDKMLTQAGVQNITLSATLPFRGKNSLFIRKVIEAKDNSSFIDFSNTGASEPDNNEGFYMDYNVVNPSFFETFNMNLISKKEFSINSISEQKGYCYINEAAMAKLAFENPLGESVAIGETKFEIVGVCSDYHTHSLQAEIMPLLILLIPDDDIESYDYYSWMSIKCNALNVNDIKQIADENRMELLPGTGKFWDFDDTDFKTETLNKVQGIEKLFGFFTTIALVIAYIGIFGLIALTIKHRTKEIGIRKVLGSSVTNIYSLIAREYLFMAILGNILAWMPAWYFSNKILQDFAYRIEINFWVFGLALIATILLTIITIAFHTIRAARTNPVKALRYE